MTLAFTFYLPMSSLLLTDLPLTNLLTFNDTYHDSMAKDITNYHLPTHEWFTIEKSTQIQRDITSITQ